MTYSRGAARRYSAVAAVSFLAGCGEPASPVAWRASLDRPARATRGAVVHVTIGAKMRPGWYVYSATQPPGGPIPTRVWLADTSSFAPAGPATGPEPTRSFDRTFGMNVEKYLRDPSFHLPLKVRPTANTGGSTILINALYQACNDTICLSPKTIGLAVPVTIE